MKLLYSIMFSAALITSANAEWKMFSSGENVYMYNSEDGTTFKYVEGLFYPEMFIDNKKGSYAYKSPAHLISDAIARQNKPKE